MQFPFGKNLICGEDFFMSKYNVFRKMTTAFLLVVTMSMAVFPNVTSAGTPVQFSDVNDKTVSPKSTQTAIYELVDLGAIKGYPDGTFKPNRAITRAQVAKMFTGALGLSLPENLEWALRHYSDVGPNHEYAVFIAATTVTGVFQGDTDGKFHAWEPITRGQMAIVLGRILKDYDTAEDVDVNFDNISGEAKEGLQIIANLGVTTEVENFRPLEKVTRAQFAAFAYRTLTVIDESRD